MKIKSKTRRVSAAAIGVAMSIALPDSLAALAQDAPYYAGKTINIIVGFPPGGGGDLGARALADRLDDHIPGNPTVVVQNMPGAGSVTAANFVYEKAPQDGTQLFMGSWYPLAQAMGAEGMRVKYDEFELIAPMRSPGGFVAYMRKDAVPGGFEQPADILKAERLRVAGVAPTSNVDERLALSMLTLGVDFAHITGHRGLALASQSVRTGEMQASAVATAAYIKTVKPNMADNGIVTPLFYWALLDAEGKPMANPVVPEGIPSFEAFYEQAHGKAPSGDLYDTLVVVNAAAEVATHQLFGPPGMDPAAIEALRGAVAATLADHVYIEQATTALGAAYEPVAMEDALGVLDRVANVKPATFEIMKSIANPETVPAQQ